MMCLSTLERYTIFHLFLIVYGSSLSLANQGSGLSPAQQKFFADLDKRDKCGALTAATSRGYAIQKFTVRTKDNYELEVHRIIHPETIRLENEANGHGEQARFPPRKPYLMLHGLLGSSASFLRNVADKYHAPPETYDTWPDVEAVLRDQVNHYETLWESVAESYRETFVGDKSDTIEDVKMIHRLINHAPKKPHSTLTEIDNDGDNSNFAKEFKQAYRKFRLSRERKPLITNSLALTLSNFGYDVWLLNMRGNGYSRSYNGPMNAEDPEYWDFNIDTQVKEDLLAMIDFVRRKSGYKAPMGLVSYSYTSMHVLNLLTKFPQYQDELQPVMLMAPTIMTGDQNKMTFKHGMNLVSNLFISKNGPFPGLARGRKDRLEKLVCGLPVLKKVCRLFETSVLHGRPHSVSSLVVSSDKDKLLADDVKCGQTSKAVLHQMIENLSELVVMPKYKPFESIRRTKLLQNRQLRRSVMIIHSNADDVATSKEVAKIRDHALKYLTLADVEIKEPEFGHVDFLFSNKNQFLVNAELVRMASVFDFLIHHRNANLRSMPSRGY